MQIQQFIFRFIKSKAESPKMKKPAHNEFVHFYSLSTSAMNSEISSKECMVSLRVAYSAPEEHELVAQSLFPRR
jgi:hypothetical protein